MGNPPTDAAINAGIAAGTVVISPAPLPGGGVNYTWACYTTAALTALDTPPTSPGTFDIMGNVDFPPVGTIVLNENRILIGDTVTGTVPVEPLTGLSVMGTAAPDFQYDFELRWIPKQASQWAWDDPPGTLTTSNTHQYTHVSGTGGVPLPPDGVTVSMYEYWTPQCSALITEGAPPAALTIVLNQPFGTYPCTLPPGETAATYMYTEKFTEASPPAPHWIYQMEPIGGKN